MILEILWRRDKEQRAGWGAGSVCSVSMGELRIGAVCWNIQYSFRSYDAAGYGTRCALTVVSASMSAGPGPLEPGSKSKVLILGDAMVSEWVICYISFLKFSGGLLHEEV